MNTRKHAIVQLADCSHRGRDFRGHSRGRPSGVFRDSVVRRNLVSCHKSSHHRGGVVVVVNVGHNCTRPNTAGLLHLLISCPRTGGHLIKLKSAVKVQLK